MLNALQKCFKICHIFGIQKPSLFFLFMLLYFYPPNECPGPIDDQGGHSLEKKIKQHEMKTKYIGFCIPKILQILKRFSSCIELSIFEECRYTYFTFRQAVLTVQAVTHSPESMSMYRTKQFVIGVPPSSKGGSQLSLTCSARISSGTRLRGFKGTSSTLTKAEHSNVPASQVRRRVYLPVSRSRSACQNV